MNNVAEYLFYVQIVLVWVVTIYWLYQLGISLMSFVKIKEKPLVDDREHKFLMVLPAHNEEKVIGNLVESLSKLDYPKDKYDVFVIADNCTDKTAEVARKAGANVVERQEKDPNKKTKGFALQWFLGNKMKEKNMDYDAFCIFDADNIVDKNFLKAMNKHLSQGEEVVQGYRDIKNPTDSWISAGYAIFYWTMHRFYHLARYNVGLSALLNGTGFMVKFDVIKDSGWDTKTLTEDIEFSLKQIIGGRKVGWATDAIVYDEQPVGFKQSWTQRIRWTVGHIQCMKEYTGDLAKTAVKQKSVLNFDGFLYIFGSIPMLVLTFVLLVLNFIIYNTGGMSTGDLWFNILKYILPTFVLPIFTGIFILAVEHKPILPMTKGLLLYPAFLGSWILINIKAVIKPDTKWEKIEHVRSISIDEKNDSKERNKNANKEEKNTKKTSTKSKSKKK